MTTVSEYQQDEFRGELRKTTRAVLEGRGGTARVQAWVDGEGDFDDLRTEIAELGWASIEIGEDDGGLGLGFAETAVVVQELGRVLTPIPFLGTAVLGTGALLEADPQMRGDWLGRVAVGEASVGVALTGRSGVPGRVDLEATEHGGELRLDGEASFALDIGATDATIVVADSGGEPVLALVETTAAGFEIERQLTVDSTRDLWHLGFDAVTVSKDAIVARGRRALERLVNRAAIAIALDSVGGADRVLESTIAYLGEREQFGRPVGSFQALKHRCVDMFLALEGARSAAEHAALVIDDPAQASVSAAIAKFSATRAYAHISAEAIQMHGGIGYTWEHDLHLYLKRAKLNQALFGDAPWHLKRVSSLIHAENQEGE